MTRRERELLEWIEENPLISQQELAQRAGITRSSVAVHISNLMKKGMILGKGYIIQKNSYAVVIGGVNMDIYGRPYSKLIEKDSNPGQVRMSFGGVGRNIAHNLRLLDSNVKLITAFGDDMNAQKINKHCMEIGIDTTASLFVPNGTTSSYLFITNDNGDMELAVSDMDIYRSLTPNYLSTKIDVINNSTLCILDTNIPEESIEYITKNCKVPIFVDPVSTSKARKLTSTLGSFHTIKPNLLETELLTGITITDERTLKKAAKFFIEAGVKQVFISLGKDGVFCANSQESCHLPNYKTNLINTTGAGDSFMAGLAWSYFNGLSLVNSAKVGLAAASICSEGRNTINEVLDTSSVLSRAGLK
jgi:pseudouridine kinase